MLLIVHGCCGEFDLLTQKAGANRSSYIHSYLGCMTMASSFNAQINPFDVMGISLNKNMRILKSCIYERILMWITERTCEVFGHKEEQHNENCAGSKVSCINYCSQFSYNLLSCFCKPNEVLNVKHTYQQI